MAFSLEQARPIEYIHTLYIVGGNPATRADRTLTRRFTIFPTISRLRSTIAKSGVKQIDLKFTDLFGRWHHITVPPSRVNEKLFTNGVGFDGSNFPGLSTVEQGDLALVPELETGYLDPFRSEPAISFICRIAEADS
ncbi:MAG TPA: glutamine synthetase, partial [Candidatus Krumholzibacteriaceae bacterium]